MAAALANRSLLALLVLAPLPIAAAAIFWAWPWWVAALPIVMLAAVVARSARSAVFAVDALLSLTGIVLVADHNSHRSGVELSALAALLVAAVYLVTQQSP